MTRREALERLWQDLYDNYEKGDLAKMEELELHVLMLFQTIEMVIPKVKARPDHKT